MARGWEKEDAGPPEKPMAAKVAAVSAEQRTVEADRQRRLQALQMQRERVLSERTSSPHRRSALEAALLEIEEQLLQLGWSLHI